MNGGLAPAEIVIVHRRQVVMHQRIAMNGFQRRADLQGRLALDAEQPGGFQSRDTAASACHRRARHDASPPPAAAGECRFRASRKGRSRPRGHARRGGSSGRPAGLRKLGHRRAWPPAIWCLCRLSIKPNSTTATSLAFWPSFSREKRLWTAPHVYPGSKNLAGP